LPGFENLIKKYGYSTPQTKWCTAHGPFGSSTKYPCGVEWIDHTVGVYATFTYPPVNRDQQAAIYACAHAANTAAYPYLAQAIASCAAGPACMVAFLAAIPIANEQGRAVFTKCIREASGLPESVKQQCNWGLIRKRLS
jgi:hypothetical protein